jgi:predicted  nucleic acid-binding Zn-ribbon protein
MDTEERVDAALDGILQRLASDLQEFTSHIADRQRAERSAFEQQMSALRNEKDLRQKQREAIQREIQNLQGKLQDLDRKDDTDNNKAMQLQREYDVVMGKWERTQQEWEARLSRAILPVVRIHLRDLAALKSG